MKMCALLCFVSSLVGGGAHGIFFCGHQEAAATPTPSASLDDLELEDTDEDRTRCGWFIVFMCTDPQGRSSAESPLLPPPPSPSPPPPNYSPPPPGPAIPKWIKCAPIYRTRQIPTWRHSLGIARVQGSVPVCSIFLLPV